MAKIIGFAGRFFFDSPEKGAETSIFLATSPEVAGVMGKYFVNKEESKAVDEMYDQQAWTRLWQISEEWAAR